jgi:ferritin-like metal-binding protein YciE
MSLHTMEDLLVHELKDLLSAENQLVKALPKMAKAASSPELQQAFEDHLEETKQQVERLQSAFEELEVSGRGKKCKAMEGLIEEGKEIVDEDADDNVKDAALIAAAQKVEHYEIAGYGTAIAFAKILGNEKVAEILVESLEEEKAADSKLTELAESQVNLQAVAAGEGENEEEEE